MNILGKTEGELIVLVEEGVQLLVGRCGIKRDYGYFSVFDCNEPGGAFMLIARIGLPPPEKNEKYLRLSQEKAQRLFSNPLHFSSYQSRDEAKDMWGGAVREVSTILSFSGLPDELADEALMLFVAYRAGWFVESRVLAIAGRSNNPYIVQII